MNDQLLDIRKRLNDASTERGRLTRIAAESGISYGTLYSVMHKEDKQPSAATVDKLAAYFKRAARATAKEGGK